MAGRVTAKIESVHPLGYVQITDVTVAIGFTVPQSEGAAILALLLANRALSIMQPEGGNVDFDLAIPVRPPVA